MSTADTDAVFTTHGGLVQAGASGAACAIQANTPRFDSYGTRWVSPAGGSGGFGAYLYGVPLGPVTFHGIHPNLTNSGDSIFAGITNWGRFVRFPDYALKATKTWSASVPANSQLSTLVTVTGVQPGTHWARATLSTNAGTCQISAHVSAANTVEVIAQNNAGSTSSFSGATVFVEAGWV